MSSFWEAHQFGPESILHPLTRRRDVIHLPAAFFNDRALEQFQSGPLRLLEAHAQISEVATHTTRIDGDALFDRPIIILSAPRAGSTLLWETLAASSQVWTIGGEGHLRLFAPQASCPFRKSAARQFLSLEPLNQAFQQATGWELSIRESIRSYRYRVRLGQPNMPAIPELSITDLSPVLPPGMPTQALA